MSVFVAFFHDHADSRNVAGFAKAEQMVAWLREQTEFTLTNTTVEVWPSGRGYVASEFVERIEESNG